MMFTLHTIQEHPWGAEGSLDWVLHDGFNLRVMSTPVDAKEWRSVPDGYKLLFISYGIRYIPDRLEEAYEYSSIPVHIGKEGTYIVPMKAIEQGIAYACPNWFNPDKPYIIEEAFPEAYVNQPVVTDLKVQYNYRLLEVKHLLNGL